MKIRGGFTFLLTALFIGLLSNSAMAADAFSRLDKWEFFVLANYNGEDTVRTYVPAYGDLHANGLIEQEAESNIGGGFGDRQDRP